MNWVDLVLILIMLMSIVSCVSRGFILSSLDLICWAGSLIISFLLYGFLSRLFDRYLSELGPWSAPLAFIIILIISRIALETGSARILERVSLRTHAHKFNKLMGILPGIINGFLWVTLLATLMVLMPISSFLAKGTQDSRLNQWTVKKMDWLEEQLSPIFSELFNNMNPSSNAAIGESESIKLPFTVKSFIDRKDLEAEMLVLINKARKFEGLKPLKADPEIAVAARKHSADMFTRGYFSHISPEGKSPFQRINDENVRYYTAGENLALAQTLEIAHEGLMNSPGHRANILRRGFGRVGIAILDGGIYGLMITQNFRN
ncbi:MAG: CvpA family protein [Pedobacter sp.]